MTLQLAKFSQFQGSNSCELLFYGSARSIVLPPVINTRFPTIIYSITFDMTSRIRNVIILGAGGSIGPSILQALEPRFNVSILSRKSSSSVFPSHYETHVVGDDYPSKELFQAFKGKDAVVSCMSPWATDTQRHIIDIAVQAKVKRFIPGEFGGDTTNTKAIAIVPPLQIRINIVENLKVQESSGLSWTAIITGQFFDWGLANGFLGFDLSNHKAMIFDDGNQPFSASTLPLIGDAVAQALLKPDITANKYVYVYSFTTTQNEVLAALEKVQGMPWHVETVQSESKIHEAQEILKSGGDAVAAFRLLLLALSYNPGYGNDFRSKDSNRALGLQKEMMEDVIRLVKPNTTY